MIGDGTGIAQLYSGQLQDLFTCSTVANNWNIHLITDSASGYGLFMRDKNQ